MEPRISLITLGVDDLDRAVAFYRPRASLAHDCGLAIGPRSATEFALAHNVASREEVDAVIEQARVAGATIPKPAGDTFWGGYAGYFLDPDAHLWEVAWNPQ